MPYAHTERAAGLPAEPRLDGAALEVVAVGVAHGLRHHGVGDGAEEAVGHRRHGDRAHTAAGEGGGVVRGGAVAFQAEGFV